MVGTAIAKGIWVGLCAAAFPGPVNVEIARRTLRTTARAGFFVGCGAVTVDCFYLIVSCLSFRAVLNAPSIKTVMVLGGSIFLIYLGITSLLAAQRAIRLEDAPPRTTPPYLTGLIVTFLSPMTVAFWFALVPTTDLLAADLPYLAVGVFVGTMSWVCFFTAILHFVGRLNKRLWQIIADILGGLTLLYFAGAAIWRFASHNL